MRISDWSSDVCSSDLGPASRHFGVTSLCPAAIVHAMFLRFLPALLTLLAAAGATAAPAKLHADHPLSYTLWDTRAARPIAEAELFARAIAAPSVRGGETPDTEATTHLQHPAAAEP